ncbi:hypothetical protein Nepgr_013989 [Nepenthes gracilis]|uniref:RING-type domain-containing protein n=1 Tax=Nepenthes gracilis TaxID=150966 RepID=A0AAD3XPF9_NEPGR|nr:hypothetical protein Nepgr_013989 [Nepenthes gracilis]
MAIVGLQSVPAPALAPAPAPSPSPSSPVRECSILTESQSSSSGRHGSQGRSGTRPSSILQMWRDLEDESALSHAHERVGSRWQQYNSDRLSTGASSSNLSQSQESEGRGCLEDSSESENGDGAISEGQIGLLSENEDHHSITSEQSHDFGEVERERVRQIFRGWMNNGVPGLGSNVPNVNSSPRAQWLGENELERVRVVREWIQMATQQRDACGGNSEEQATEFGSQIERVRDGLVLDHNVGQSDSTRRDIRRLCGRQALLDLLAKKEQEKQRELHTLLQCRPVSSFAFRNRIQSLLRVRLLQNKRLVEHTGPNPAAESELGLLRQRHTVSDLREGFLSRLDNNVHAQESNLSDSSSNSDANGFIDDEAQVNSSIEVLDDAQEQIDSVNQESDIGTLSDHTVDLIVCVIEERNLEGSTATNVETGMEHAFDDGAGNEEESDSDDFYGRNVPSDDQPWQIICHESSRHEDGDNSHHEEANEVIRDQYDLVSEGHVVPDISSYSDNLGSNASEHLQRQQSTTQSEDWQEQATGQWEGSVLSNEWGDGDVDEIPGRNRPSAGHEMSYGMLRNEGGEQNHTQEASLHESGPREEPMGESLEGQSDLGVTSAARVDAYYFSDDDNMYGTELRELLNRRRVSSLLHSGFRESLDQLIQSYVERQSQAIDGWELQEALSPPVAMHDEEHLSTVQNGDPGAVEGSLATLSPTTVAPQRFWDRDLRHRSWSRHDTHQHPGTEWEIINDLRIDMARLQQRLNNMQRMLEACMDMQLELQRSVRQEVAAALNRPIKSSEASENEISRDESKWDCARKGICCICCNSNIDSLLYRCGHMCTCTKCANVLVDNGNCPMCRAPVIEVIRAYPLQ